MMQPDVPGGEETPPMEDDVWARVDRELHRRRLTWAKLGRAIGASAATMTHWGKRGVPPVRYIDVAGFLGWSVEQLCGLAPEPRKQPSPAVAPEPVYTKRANDIARMFDELKDPDVRQSAYAAVQLILQMAKAGQRIPEPPPPEPPSSGPPPEPPPPPPQGRPKKRP